MEFDPLMMDILVYVSCKFEMYIFKIAHDKLSAKIYVLRFFMY